MDLSAIVSRAPSAAWRDVEGEVVVVSIDVNRVRLLSDVAGFVWKRCDGVAVSRLVDDVHAAYDCSWDQARDDVVRFLDDLAARGMIRVEAGG